MSKNSVIDLGVMTRVEDLRSTWADEARNFTPWLAGEENLKLLGDAVGIDLVLQERESSVGSFNVDLFVKEEGSDRRVIIENQLETTDHDHLGKLITYASGKSADVVIWVVKKARDEHRRAIEWLNQRTDDSLGFFLVEVELWRIDDSRKAVRFNVVEQPNEWAKTVKNNDLQSETKLFQLDFWSGFRDAAKQDASFMQVFSLRKEHARSWYDLSIGCSGCVLSLSVSKTQNQVETAFYIRNDKELFEELRANAVVIESEIGAKLVWHEATKNRYVALRRTAKVMDRTCWNEIFDWYRQTAILFRKVFKPYVG